MNDSRAFVRLRPRGTQLLFRLLGPLLQQLHLAVVRTDRGHQLVVRGNITGLHAGELRVQLQIELRQLGDLSSTQGELPVDLRLPAEHDGQFLAGPRDLLQPVAQFRFVLQQQPRAQHAQAVLLQQPAGLLFRRHGAGWSCSRRGWNRRRASAGRRMVGQELTIRHAQFAQRHGEHRAAGPFQPHVLTGDLDQFRRDRELPVGAGPSPRFGRHVARAHQQRQRHSQQHGRQHPRPSQLIHRRCPAYVGSAPIRRPAPNTLQG